MLRLPACFCCWSRPCPHSRWPPAWTPDLPRLPRSTRGGRADVCAALPHPRSLNLTPLFCRAPGHIQVTRLARVVVPGQSGTAFPMIHEVAGKGRLGRLCAWCAFSLVGVPVLAQASNPRSAHIAIDRPTDGMVSQLTCIYACQHCFCPRQTGHLSPSLPLEWGLRGA